MATSDLPAGRMESLFRSLYGPRQVKILALVAVLLLWELVGTVLPRSLFAPFSAVAVAYIELAQGPMFELGIQTLREMMMGFGLAVAFAVPVGLIMGRSRVADKMINPWVQAFFATATSALLPLLVIVFGIDLSFRLSIVWLACVWHILINIYHGARGVDAEYLDVGRSFDVSTLTFYRSIVFPAIMPFTIAGLRMGLTRSIRGIILAEFYIVTGYGGLLRQFANQSADLAPVLALALTIMVFGYGLRVGLEKFQLWLYPWSDVDAAMG